MPQKVATYFYSFSVIKYIQGALHFQDLKASDVSTWVYWKKKIIQPYMLSYALSTDFRMGTQNNIK